MYLKSSPRNRSLLELAMGIVTIILVIYIASFAHLRFDLTSEKRYTLDKNTKEILSNLDDIVHVRVYLDGDLPLGFRYMRRELMELLGEFEVYGQRFFQFEFIDPAALPNKTEREALLRDLYDKGLEPTNVQERDDKGGSSQRVIFPGAVISCKGKELVVNLLKNNPAHSGDENINISIQGFEYVLLNAILKAQADKLPKLAFVHGHGQLNEFDTGDIAQELVDQFEVHRVMLGGEVGGLDPYAVVIMAGPTMRVPESDKLVLDQYIMGGGKVLWFVDGVTVSIDSLSNGATTLAFPNDHNLEDILFRYGARVNPTLIQDMQCAVIPVNVSLQGQDSKFAPTPWVYYPLLNSPSSHPITRNLNLITSKFVSPVDTVGMNYEVNKQYLLKTSPYTRTVNVPAFINLAQIEESPLEREFTQSNVPVAVLLEGMFPSVFTNRPLASYNNGKSFRFREKSVPTRMIIVSDADIIRNEVSRRGDGAYITPLGFDRYTSQTFGNKELVVNMVNYLNDDSGLMNLRSREFKLRLLDKHKVLEQSTKWQILNLLIPSLILIVLVAIWLLIRRNRYAK
ncbi:MAG: gliding motility-associated ABC transporter substrate-binding protein GldG [Bacteroidales bacterium]|nr:gliding motility-associated ABC transporter substrate-binding protein GldG [Bacteroidales bacterium]MDY0196349.1 gliding motility-associated ABC transporter substrate-binding protein GldG [Tenuifilaceae bacterium]